VVFSPDGVGLASCARSGNVRLWVWAKGECLYNLASAHDASVNFLAFSSDGSRIATASSDCSVKVWLANGFEQVSEFSGAHEGSTTAIAFSSSEHTIDASKVRVAQGNRQAVHISESVEVMASVSEDGTLRFWDVNAAADKFRLEQLQLKYQEQHERIRENGKKNAEQSKRNKHKEQMSREERFRQEQRIQWERDEQKKHNDLLAAYEEPTSPPVRPDEPSSPWSSRRDVSKQSKQKSGVSWSLW